MESIKAAIPDTPILISGGLGGPFVMYVVTPARNALTLGSKDTKSSVRQIYGRVFGRSFVQGWSGGIYPAIAACPQFLCLGPAYHFIKDSGLGNSGGVIGSSILETVIAYGAETKNAQVMTNATMGKMVIPKVQTPYIPWGPGLTLHVSRNLVATMGIRVFNTPSTLLLEKMNAASGNYVSQGAVTLCGDFLANVLASVLTMPLHQMYNYTVTSPELWKMSTNEYLGALKTFLRNQYIPDGRVSPVLKRDACLRILYLASAYTMYVNIERSLVSYYRSEEKEHSI